MRHLALPIVACLVLAGCGDGSGGAALGPDGVERHDPNATDAAFVRAMVPHQAAGVEIARTAERRAKRAELRALGSQIAARQQPTVERLRELKPDVAPRAGAAPKPAPVDPRALRDPVSFDHRFMTMMIRHHEDSIVLAEVEQHRGGDDRIKLIAAEIFESQKRELERLKRFLRTWYGVDGPQGPGGTPPPSGGDPDT
jgi:uncharacterized protein (DUF305 family)